MRRGQAVPRWLLGLLDGVGDDLSGCLRAGTVALVVAAALAYGGVTAPARAGFEIGAVALAIGAAVRVFREGRLILDGARLTVPCVVLIAIGVAQTIPVPSWVREALGSAPEQGMQARLLPEMLPLSLNAGATEAALYAVVAIAIVFLAAATSVSAGGAVQMATWLVAAAGLLAAASIWGFLAPGALFSMPAHIADDRLHGPFVNADHYANWLAGLLPLCIAGLFEDRARGTPALRRYRVLCVGTLPLLSVALGLTFSRGGILAAACGLVYLGARSARGRQQRAVMGIGVAGVAAFAYAAWAGGGALAGRFSALWSDPLADMRLGVWSAALEGLARAPVLGFGLGAFMEAARPLVGMSVPSRLVVDYAHNELLQVSVELGLAGLGVVVWGLLRWLRVAGAEGQPSDEAEGRWIARGAAAGVIALLAGALVDFAIRIPAVAALGAVLGALAICAGRCAAAQMLPRRSAVGLLVVVGLLSVPVVNNAIESWRCAVLVSGSLPPATSDWSAEVGEAEEAAARRPRRGEHHARLAWLLSHAGYRAWGEGAGLRGETLPDEASRARLAQALYVRGVNHYLDAIAADRTNPEYRRDLGWVLGNLAALEEAFARFPFSPEALLDRLPVDVEPSDLVLALYRDGARLEPRNAGLQLTLGRWALAHLSADGEMGLGMGRHDPAPLEEIAATAIGRAIDLDAGVLADAVADALRRGAVYADLRAMVPSRGPLLWRLGLCLEQQSRPDLVNRLVAEIDSPRDADAARLAEEMALLIARRRDLVSASLALGRLGQLMPASPAVAASGARVNWRQGEYAKAEVGFGGAIAALGPSAFRNRLESDLGLMLIDSGQLDRADEHFEAIKRLRPHDPWGHLGAGMVLDRRQEWVEATRSYQRARALAGDDEDVLYRLGLQYYRREHHHQAAAIWETGTQASPKSADLHLWLARALAKGFKLEAARRSYETALRLRPADPAAQAELEALAGGVAQ